MGMFFAITVLVQVTHGLVAVLVISSQDYTSCMHSHRLMRHDDDVLAHAGEGCGLDAIRLGDAFAPLGLPDFSLADSTGLGYIMPVY